MNIRELHFPADEGLYQAIWQWIQVHPDWYKIKSYEDLVIKPETVRDFGIFDGEKLLGVLVLMHTRPGESEAGLFVPPRPRIRALLTAYWFMTVEYFKQGVGHRLFTVTQPCAAHHKLLAKLGWRKVQDNEYEFTVLDYVK